MNNPRLYFFIGFPGAGKTTIAKFIEEKTGAVHLWADQIRQQMFKTPTHSKEESRTLYAELNKQAEQLLKDSKSVIFDTNFNYLKDRDLMRSIAKKYDAEAIAIWVNTPKQIAKDRALHSSHRDRNGYMATMSEAEFEHLSNHLEQPIEQENVFMVDGTDINFNKLSQDLKL